MSKLQNMEQQRNERDLWDDPIENTIPDLEDDR